MKKFPTVMLLFLIALLGHAHAESVIWHDDKTSIVAFWQHDESVYVFTYEAYFRLTAEGLVDERPFPFLFENAKEFHSLLLVPSEDALWSLEWGLDGEATLAEIIFDEAGGTTLGEQISISWGEILNENQPCIRDPLIREGVLAFIDVTGETRGVPVTIDLETGKRRMFETDADDYVILAMEIFPYQESMVFIASAVVERPKGVQIYTLDLATGEIAPLFKIPMSYADAFGAPVYDVATNDIFLVMNEAFLRVRDFDPDSIEVIGDASSIFTWADTYAALLDGGVIAIADWNTVWAYNLEEAEAARLSISADNDAVLNDAYYAFFEENPGATIKISNDYVEPGAISAAILTQSTEYDIYQTYLGWQDYAALYDKGYLPSLSDSGVLAGLVGEMYPAVRDVITKDGALVAFPTGYDMFAPTCNLAAFAALGLTEEDVPTDWLAFLRLLQRVPGLIEGTDYSAFDPMNVESELPGMLLSAIFDAYELYLEYDPSAGMRFDTEILRALLAEYEKIDFSGLGALEERREYAERSREGYILFQLDGWVSCESIGESRVGNLIRYGEDAPEPQRIMPLALAPGMERAVEGHLNVAIVNPYSKNREAALRFLEIAAGRMPETTRANLCPGWTAPIKLEDADERIAEREERIAALDREVEKATGDEQAQFRALLDAAKAELATEWEFSYWLVTEEDLAVYRLHAEHMYVRRFFGLNTEGAGEFSAQVGMYLSGVVDAETMLKNIDRKVNMMLLED